MITCMQLMAETEVKTGRDLKNQNFVITNYLDLPVFTLHAISQFFI